MRSAREKIAEIEAFEWSDEEVDAVAEAGATANPWNHKSDELKHVKEVLRALKQRFLALHLELQGKTCCYCKGVIAGGGYFTIDREHILPKDQFVSLTYDPMNLSVSCKRCNMEYKKERTDFIVDIVTILDDVRNHERYLFVHPNFDTWSAHLARYSEQANESLLVKYTVVPDSAKGAFTYDFFNLSGLEIDTFDRAQGMAVLNEQEDTYRQALENSKLMPAMFGGFDSDEEVGDDDGLQVPSPWDDELEAIIAMNALDDAFAGRDFDPDADDWDEEDPIGSNVPT